VTKVKIAVVQPRSYLRYGAGRVLDDPTAPEDRNLTLAHDYIEEAAGNGAQLVAFPELYPGPSAGSDALEYDTVVDSMRQKARDHGVYVLFGGARQVSNGFNNRYHLADPHRDSLHVYDKIVPAMNEETMIGGDEPRLVETDLCRIGLLICWEAWFPELPRVLAMQGADIVFFPTGGLIYELHDVWRAILQARAAENTIYTASSVNIWGVEAGMSYVFSPEGEVAALTTEGINYAELDLDRLSRMRSEEEEFTVPKKYRTIPGTINVLDGHLSRLYQQATKAHLDRRGGPD
jgi:predicted amidohydrolase